MYLRIAIAQIPVVLDIQSNAAAIRRAVDCAVKEGADMLLTPEGSLSGYTHVFDPKRVSEELEDLTDRAAQHGLGLALGTCYVEDDNRCYNQIRFYDTDGRYLGFHSKMLACGTLADPPEGEISHYSMSPLRTFDIKGITVGGLVCNDLWANPCCTPMPDNHLTQRLSEMGARVIFHAVNGGRSDSESPDDIVRGFHESNLRMRAQAGKLWIVSVDNCYPLHVPCSSVGGVIDPNGNRVLEMPDRGEQLCVCTIDVSCCSSMKANHQSRFHTLWP